MRQTHFQRALPLLATTLLAATLLVSGCGRSAINPLEPGLDEPGAEDPYPEDPGFDDPGFDDPGIDDPYPFDPQPIPIEPGHGNGGGAVPPSAPGNPGHVLPALRPLPRPTPTPKPGQVAPAPVDHQAAMERFVDQLREFGYDAEGRTDGVHNVRMQLLPLTRVQRFDWWRGTPGGSDWIGLTYGRRKNTFPQPHATMEEWMSAGKALAARSRNVSFYVARKELYRHIIHDRYASDGTQSGELLFFKRLNNTGFMVCYKANGYIYDYGFFPAINWREFLPVPASFLR